MSTTKPAGTPIEGATALVTGGNRGFGRAIVEELLDRGAANVYATTCSPHTESDERTSHSCSTSRPPGTTQD